jgi:hypothetical protein
MTTSGLSMMMKFRSSLRQSACYFEKGTAARSAVDVFGAEVLARADIDERLIPERVRMFLAACVGSSDASQHDFMVCLQGFLIPRLGHGPKMKLPVAVRQLAEVWSRLQFQWRPVLRRLDLEALEAAPEAGPSHR